MKPGVRGKDTLVAFFGKNSPNPGTPWYANDYKDLGPAVGFAWQVPWFGEGKTTIRGGYQMTYNSGQVANAITQDFANEAKKKFEDAEKIKIEQGFVSLGGAYEEPENPDQAIISKVARASSSRTASW